MNSHVRPDSRQWQSRCWHLTQRPPHPGRVQSLRGGGTRLAQQAVGVAELRGRGGAPRPQAGQPFLHQLSHQRRAADAAAAPASRRRRCICTARIRRIRQSSSANVLWVLNAELLDRLLHLFLSLNRPDFHCPHHLM